MNITDEKCAYINIIKFTWSVLKGLTPTYEEEDN